LRNRLGREGGRFCTCRKSAWRETGTGRLRRLDPLESGSAAKIGCPTVQATWIAGIGE